MKQLAILGTWEIFNKSFTIYGTNENPLFLAKDVAKHIGHTQASRMIEYIDDDEKVMNIVHTLGGEQQAWFLTENGLYEVLMQSRKPIAKKFKTKVKEILKSIRKTGQYQLRQPLHQNVLSSIHAKMYNELPVLTLVDVQYLVNVPCFTLRYFIREHNPSPLIVDIDYFFLQGLSLLSYKAQNGYRTKNNSKLIVITKSGFIKICHYFDIGNAENALRLFNSTIDDMNVPAIKVPTKSDDTQTENSSAITQPNLYKAELIIKLIPTATDYIEKRFMHMAAMRILFGKSYSSSLDILRESLELKKELKKLDSKDKRLVKRAMKDSLPYKSLPKHLQGFLNETFA